MNNQPTQYSPVEFELATLALKGKRFKEAATEFTNLIVKNQSSEAWCGLGLSKFGLILEDVTTDEIFYCFSKAIEAEKNKTKEIEELVIQSSIDVAGQLYKLYVDTIQRSRIAKKHQTIAIISTVVGSIFTLEAAGKNKIMGSIVSAGFTALSFEQYKNAAMTVAEMNILSERVVAVIESIKANVKSFVTIEQKGLETFNGLILQYEKQVMDALKSDEEKAKDNETKQNKIATEQRQKYIEQKKGELADDTHPFHVNKQEALWLFEEKKYSKSLPITNYALSLYSEDHELVGAQEKMLKFFVRRDLFIAILPWLVITSVIGFGSNQFIAVFIISSLLLAFLLNSRNKKRKEKAEQFI